MTLTLTYAEARLFHHFVEHLGRWLDCTNAARIFTLTVPEKAPRSPILVNAVLCFSARHQGMHDVAERAYEVCISGLVERLTGASVYYDESLLSAVLLLHFADQLEGRPPALLHPHHLHASTNTHSTVPRLAARQPPPARHLIHPARLHALIND